MKASLRALLTGVVDYAGLFPPAGLDMPTSVENYQRYRTGDHAWMLGRMVVPVARFDEFLHAAHAQVTATGDPWRVSAIIGGDVVDELARVAAFNQTNDGALVDAVEARAATAAEIDAIAAALPGGVRAFVEIPVAPGDEVDALVRALAAARLRAKIRTGGVSAAAFPGTAEVARFVRSCFAANVPFKATAGLHHPVRGRYALTYEDGADHAVMHGFLNVFLAGAFCFNGLGAVDAPRLLALDSVSDWSFDDEGARWEDYRISTAEIDRIRRRFAISFGSCSFEEPIEDLRRLGLMG